MKKTACTLLFLLLFCMCSCSVPATASYEDNQVKALKSWFFQFNKGTNDYSLFFGLLNKNDEYISADVDVDIRIVNEEDKEVYKYTKTVLENDFDYYTSQIAGEEYLAEIKIPADDIIPGKSINGTVYLKVYKNDSVRFDEVNCSAFNCLPISDAELIFEPLPLSIDVKGYDKSIKSTIQIDDIGYTFEKDYVPRLQIVVSGMKIYSGQDSMPGYDIISYKLYDSEEYMIASGNIYLDSMDQGDKFKNDSIVIYDITPGETYKLILGEYHW